MTQFNISGSNVGQLNDKGNNYQVSGVSGNNAISETGEVIQSDGAQNKLAVGRKDSFLSMLVGKLKSLWVWITGA